MGVLLLYAAFACVVAVGAASVPRLPVSTAPIVGALAAGVTVAQTALLATAPKAGGCVASGTAGHRLVGPLAVVAIVLGAAALGIGSRAGVLRVRLIWTISGGVLGALSAIAAILTWNLVALCGS